MESALVAEIGRYSIMSGLIYHSLCPLISRIFHFFSVAQGDMFRPLLSVKLQYRVSPFHVPHVTPDCCIVGG